MKAWSQSSTEVFRRQALACLFASQDREGERSALNTSVHQGLSYKTSRVLIAMLGSAPEDNTRAKSGNEKRTKKCNGLTARLEPWNSGPEYSDRDSGRRLWGSHPALASSRHRFERCPYITNDSTSIQKTSAFPRLASKVVSSICEGTMMVNFVQFLYFWDISPLLVICGWVRMVVLPWHNHLSYYWQATNIIRLSSSQQRGWNPYFL